MCSRLALPGMSLAALPLAAQQGRGSLANRPNSTGTSAKLDTRTPERWFDTAQFVNPPNFTFGNLGRVLPDVRSPGVVNFDRSVIKDTRLWENLRLQFRAEMFNCSTSSTTPTTATRTFRFLRVPMG